MGSYSFLSYNNCPKNTREFPIAVRAKKLYNKQMDEKIRINKYLSDAGVCSRREADRLISENRITVNGRNAQSGEKVSAEDYICIDEKPITKNEKSSSAF